MALVPASRCQAAKWARSSPFEARSTAHASTSPEGGDEMNAVTKFAESHAEPRLHLPAHPISGLAGASFKHEHLAAILSEGRQDIFLEVHAENYMGAGGRPHHALETIRRDFPVSLHVAGGSAADRRGAPRTLSWARRTL